MFGIRILSRKCLRFDNIMLRSLFNSSIYQGHLKEELAGPLEIKQPNQVVAELVQVSSSQQSREQVSELGPLVDDVENLVKSLNFEELFLSVRALTFWPEAVRNRATLLNVPDRRDKDIRRLFDVLSLECNRRMFSYRCENDEYISLSNENIGNVLNLCEIWNVIDEVNSYKANGFVITAVNKMANSTKNSKSRFRRFDKDTFVRFMKLVGQSHLGDEFHKYYCSVKFLEFIPEMNQEDLFHVCKAFNIHKMHGHPTHPVEVRIRKLLIDAVLKNIDGLDSATLSMVCKYISGGQSLIIIDDCILLQQEVVEAGLVDRLSVTSLIRLMNLVSRMNMGFRTGVHYPLVDAVVERLTREGELVHNLSLRNLCDLSNVICFHRDTPAARNVLLKGLDCILAEEPELLQTKEAVTFLLALAHLGLYNRSACELLFTSPVLTQHSHKAGGRIMNKLVRYARNGLMNQFLGGRLLSLQSMLELECPEYTGPRLTAQLEDTIRNWSPDPLPMSAGKLDLYPFVKQGRNFHAALENIFGSGMVHETMINPLNGLIVYVSCLNSAGEPISIPESFKQQPIYQPKVLGPKETEEVSTWLGVVQLSSALPSEALVRVGGPNTLRRIMQKQGFTLIIFNPVGIRDVEFGYEVKEQITQQLRHLKLS